jgi:two-component system sensor histidine kinase YesM
LQPLVENAIFHGIEPKGGTGCILIKACETETGILISVFDDGIGMKVETIKKIFNGEENTHSALFKQIGILNVHKRIQHNFGKDFGISINSNLGEYTCINVHLPRHPL